jgi:hypothetical protein
VRGEDDGCALGHFVLVLDEDRPALAQSANDVGVVDDLLPDVHGRAVPPQRQLDRLDRSLDAGAVPPRRREQDPLDHELRVAAVG